MTSVKQATTKANAGILRYAQNDNHVAYPLPIVPYPLLLAINLHCLSF